MVVKNKLMTKLWKTALCLVLSVVFGYLLFAEIHAETGITSTQAGYLLAKVCFLASFLVMLFVLVINLIDLTSNKNLLEINEKEFIFQPFKFVKIVVPVDQITDVFMQKEVRGVGRRSVEFEYLCFDVINAKSYLKYKFVPRSLAYSQIFGGNGDVIKVLRTGAMNDFCLYLEEMFDKKLFYQDKHIAKRRNLLAKTVCIVAVMVIAAISAANGLIWLQREQVISGVQEDNLWAKANGVAFHIGTLVDDEDTGSVYCYNININTNEEYISSMFKFEKGMNIDKKYLSGKHYGNVEIYLIVGSNEFKNRCVALTIGDEVVFSLDDTKALYKKYHTKAVWQIVVGLIVVCAGGFALYFLHDGFAKRHQKDASKTNDKTKVGKAMSMFYVADDRLFVRNFAAHLKTKDLNKLMHKAVFELLQDDEFKLIYQDTCQGVAYACYKKNNKLIYKCVVEKNFLFEIDYRNLKWVYPTANFLTEQEEKDFLTALLKFDQENERQIKII